MFSGDSKKTIFLIDGSSMLYRGYYGMHPLHTSKGLPVQAVFTFCRMIRHLIDTFKPRYVAIAWDSKGKTERHEIYAEYKATRQAAPSDLFDQKEYILQFADLIGIKQISRAKVEADDLMFSIAHDAVEAGDNAVIVTSDKDLRQAITDGIFVYDPIQRIMYDKAVFVEKMGFTPDKLPFYSALIGDPSDNIPGVKGIGRKTAYELVTQFNSLEELYENLDEVKKGRAHTALQEHEKDAFLSQELFVLHYHKTNINKQSCAFDMNRWSDAYPLFEELEFTSLIKEIKRKPAEKKTAKQDIIERLKKLDFKLVTTHQELTDLCTLLKKQDAFAFDTETTGLRPLEVDLVGVSFSVRDDQTFYIPCGHKQTSDLQRKNKDVGITLEDVVKYLAPIFADNKITKYAHNIKFDRLVLYNHGIEIAGPYFDTCVAASLVIRSWQSAALARLSIFYFDEPMLLFEQMVNNEYADFSYVPPHDALYYAGNDARQTWRLVSVLKKKLKLEKLDNLFDTIESPLIEVLYDMEKGGIYLDIDALARVNNSITKDLKKIEHDIRILAGTTINLNSPRQVAELLFDKLKLPPGKKGKTGVYSTGQGVLEELAQEYIVPGLILNYRELAKLKSTYLDALPGYINPKTDRIHTSFSQVRVATGRLSSSEPNMQNIPTSSYGIAIRGAFKPNAGHVFISADYSQIELRVLAHLSQDKHLIKAFKNNHDIHAETASRLFDVPLDQVSHDQRQIGKRINFSIMYGMTPYGLKNDLGISYEDAKRYIKKYFEQYPGVSIWMEGVIDFAKKHGYVANYWGRRRYIPGIYEKNKHLYEEARRVAINSVAQGTSSEIMKMGMINLHNAFREKKFDAHIVLQIHDELLITVADGQKEEVESLITRVLDSVVNWSVPFVVTTRVGTDWEQVTK